MFWTLEANSDASAALQAGALPGVAGAFPERDGEPAGRKARLIVFK